MTAIDPKLINASPTKEFFIDMLIRDVPLNRAIIDLVDNSVDGARRIRPAGDFTGLWIRIEINESNFRIADNCGGIPIEIARNYAFRFGRPVGAPPTAGSIGQFGVGMKRTFFKLGHHFCVESSTPESKFIVDIDVEEWTKQQSDGGVDDWHFKFKELQEGIAVDADNQGTIIEVKRLRTSVSESFVLESFINRVWQEIAEAHTLSMDQGLIITLNNIPLRHDPLQLLNSELIQPAYINILYDSYGPKPVKVKLYAGVSDREKEEGGWYVFCNGRMVLCADKTNVTIWGEGDGDRVPKYHGNYARFRGLAYFDSDDASLLPWTTTKTGVDSDSPVYRAARQQMIELSRPVLDFLRKLEDERKKHEDGDIPNNPLAQAVSVASGVDTVALAPRVAFVAPQPPPLPAGPRMQRVQYSKPFDDIEKAKKLLRVTSLKEVGEKTFEYYLAYEGGDDVK